MAKETKKTKTKARMNWGWDLPEERDGKASRKTRSARNKASKNIKKLGFKAILIVLLVMLIGGAVGAGACWFVCRNDCFTIIGEDEITLTLREEGEAINNKNSYIDEGVKVVSFGRDISKDIEVETNLKIDDQGNFTADEVGTYYIIYKTNDIKYGKIFTVERIRLITFVEPQPDVEVD